LTNELRQIRVRNSAGRKVIVPIHIRESHSSSRDSQLLAERLRVAALKSAEGLVDNTVIHFLPRMSVEFAGKCGA
jgi:hypothetical protein